MKWRKITAVFPGTRLEKVEQRLVELGIKGFTVTRGKGYGERLDFYGRDWLVSHACLEVFTMASNAEKIAQAIMDAAHTGTAGDGLVAILPVEQVYRIRTKSEASEEAI